MAAPKQSGAPPENLPQAALVTPQPGARMTQVLVSLNTLGLEMNRQVMRAVRVLQLKAPLKLSENMEMLKVWILSPD